MISIINKQVFVAANSFMNPFIYALKVQVYIRVHRILFIFDFYSAHTFFFVFFNSKNNLFSYIF